MNATVAPSGEKTGNNQTADYCGEVRGRAVKSERESKVRRALVPLSTASENINDFPSGDQSILLQSITMCGDPTRV